METILADASVGINELQVNPACVIESAAQRPVVVLKDDKPLAYLISADAWEAIYNALEDIELAKIVRERENGPFVEVNLDDL